MNAQTTRRRDASRPQDGAEPITPGGYMRDCRRRAKVSIAQSAAAIAVLADARRIAREDIAAMEANEPGDYSRLVMMLRDRRVFPFDMGLFAALAAETACPETGAEFGL